MEKEGATEVVTGWTHDGHGQLSITRTGAAVNGNVAICLLRPELELGPERVPQNLMDGWMDGWMDGGGAPGAVVVVVVVGGGRRRGAHGWWWWWVGEWVDGCNLVHPLDAEWP